MPAAKSIDAETNFSTARPSAAAIDGIRVGVGGWTFAPWRDNFFPRGLPQRLELEFASRHLNAIEINGTFHREQSAAVYANWRGRIPEGFVFSVKAPKRIVEARALAANGPAIARFLQGIVALEDRLGPILWQLGPYRKFDGDDFRGFLDALPATVAGVPIRHALEVRQASFANADVVKLLRERGIALVHTDSAEYPNIAEDTAGFAYARLRRARDALPDGYTDADLDAWAARARTWAAGGVPADLPQLASPTAKRGQTSARRDVFVYFINADKQRNPAAALALLRRLDAA